MPTRRLSLALFAAVCAAPAFLAAPPAPLPDGTAEATKAMAGFRTPPGLKVELFAAEPRLASPVAIALDEHGRVFVAEEYRFNQGTEENRTRPFLLEDDLQIRTVADRLAMYRKWAHKFDGGMDWFRKHSEVVRRLEDTTGDGKADRSTVFADGFNDPLDGLAAGILAHDGDVYFTCIPNLWRLRDTTGDGKADVREKLLTGFGVNCAYLGHDLHGLCWGPDGKLYFSIGDRGFHVETKEGTTLSGPRTGAVFRCDPDGKHLEVVARGLRNPQELAFDEFGNLFADDNNCDKGDHSRLVYVVEGGDSGWNMAYQTMPPPYLTGPWHAERIWHLPHPGQPAWIVPPVGKLGAGPGGFAFSSGVGLPARYRNTFLMCNYTGNGGIEAFKVVPKGAGFEIVDPHDFLKPVQATDVEIGYDGKIYVSDFVKLLWNGGSGGGRIYTLSDPEGQKSPAVAELKKLFAEGFGKRSEAELGELLGHADQRVRLRAQFELAKRGSKGQQTLIRLSHQPESPATESSRLARLHAIWGLGQLKHADAILGHLNDADAEVRAQAAKVLGDIGHVAAADRLIERLADPEPRPRFFAAQSLGKLKHSAAVQPLFAALKENADRDPFLRAAAVVALERIGDRDAVHARAADAAPAVRLAVLLTQRRWADERVARFLNDAELSIVTEAARAIHDVPMDAALPALAKQLARTTLAGYDAEALIRRAISANLRLGGIEHARAVARFAGDPTVSARMRGEALAALADWSEPSPRDRVTGFWRPLPKRDPAIARQAVEPELSRILASASGDLPATVARLVTTLNLKADDGVFADWVADAKREPTARTAALQLLAARKARRLDEALATALADTTPSLRAEARDLIAARDPGRGVRLFRDVLDASSVAVVEKQRALAALARIKHDEAAPILDAWADRLAAGTVPLELQLDVTEALTAAATPKRQAAVKVFEAKLGPADRKRAFQMSLAGGDAEKGREVFVAHSEAQCMRCHSTTGAPNMAGPDLAKVASRYQEKTREFFLESLLEPSAKVAPGFGTVSLVLTTGKVVSGVLQAEDDKSVTVQTPDGTKRVVAKDDIEERTAPVSLMPSIERTLTPREVRDLIEYLMTLK